MTGSGLETEGREKAPLLLACRRFLPATRGAEAREAKKIPPDLYFSTLA